jgi:hypothetical protein
VRSHLSPTSLLPQRSISNTWNLPPLFRPFVKAGDLFPASKLDNAQHGRTTADRPWASSHFVITALEVEPSPRTRRRSIIATQKGSGRHSFGTHQVSPMPASRHKTLRRWDSCRLFVVSSSRCLIVGGPVLPIAGTPLPFCATPIPRDTAIAASLALGTSLAASLDRNRRPRNLVRR